MNEPMIVAWPNNKLAIMILASSNMNVNHYLVRHFRGENSFVK